ncbi:MAG TPA: hypothetical protein VFR32_07990 [Gaiellaceae bacterium]|nr:hypothetical protein [Gaiellaceae bacterium]
MDKLAEINHGAKVVLGSAILLLIFSFFNWFEVEGTDFGDNMWSGIGVVAGLLLIALIAWQAVRLANINLNVGVGPAMITAFLAVLTFVFVFIRWIDKPGGGLVEDAIDRTVWAWIGLILAILIVGGAWANMKMTGESLSDLQKLGGGTGGGGTTPPPPSTPTQTPPPPPPGDDNP